MRGKVVRALRRATKQNSAITYHDAKELWNNTIAPKRAKVRAMLADKAIADSIMQEATHDS